MTAVSGLAVNERVLLRDDQDSIATLTLNRPEQYNALSEALLDALNDAFDAIAEDSSVRIVVLAARGKAFCAGHDLKEMRAKPDQAYYEHLFKKCSRMMLGMIRLPQPVISRVHGIATAAGCQLVASSDLAVASTDARFAASGINVGLFCMTPGVALARNLGRKRAFEMLFTGDFITAEDALKLGLVNRVAPPAKLDDAVAALARPILGKSQVAVTAGKRVLYRQVEMDIESAYEFASEEMARNMMSHDAAEGIDAFIEKRIPEWRDE
jgi:enoyl-CoA hydratase/carnithine racemase